MLTVYTLEESKQWDKVVVSFEKYDVYWLSEYARAFQMHGDGVPLLFYYETNATRGNANFILSQFFNFHI